MDINILKMSVLLEYNTQPLMVVTLILAITVNMIVLYSYLVMDLWSPRK